LSPHHSGVRVGPLAQETQTLLFPEVSDAQFGGAPISLAATASSSLPVSYEIISGPGLLTGSTLTSTGVGAIVIRATQAGDFTYAAATPVERTIQVSAPSAFTTFLIAAGVADIERSATADPDHDNIPNLLEYALGLTPMNADSAGLPSLEVTADTLSLSYRPTRPDVRYLVQTTTDLGDPASWSETGLNQGSPDDNGLVSATVPLGASARFLRLSVVLSP
jgi:hypothetical protein